METLHREKIIEETSLDNQTGSRIEVARTKENASR
jgi:hypothetical protein